MLRRGPLHSDPVPLTRQRGRRACAERLPPWRFQLRWLSVCDPIPARRVLVGRNLKSPSRRRLPWFVQWRGGGCGGFQPPPTAASGSGAVAVAAAAPRPLPPPDPPLRLGEVLCRTFGQMRRWQLTAAAATEAAVFTRFLLAPARTDDPHFLTNPVADQICRYGPEGTTGLPAVAVTGLLGRGAHIWASPTEIRPNRQARDAFRNHPTKLKN